MVDRQIGDRVMDEQAFEERRQGRLQQVRLILLVILGLNLTVAIAKLVVGLGIGSLSMTSDGIHSLLDSASNVVGLIGIAIAARPPDPDHPYGHDRFETLASLAIAGFMLLVLFRIAQSGWDRLQGGNAPEITLLALVVMLITLAINLGVTAWEHHKGRQLESQVLLADAQNTLSDVFVSLSVLASFALIEAGYPLADLVVTVIIAALIARGAWQIVRDATLVLADTAAEEPEEIRDAVLAVDGVLGAHAIRSRGSGDRIWVDLHIQVDPELTVEAGHDIASEVARRVEEELKRPADVTVHVEPATSEHLGRIRRYERDPV